MLTSSLGQFLEMEESIKISLSSYMKPSRIVINNQGFIIV